jgi:hypothetical protein
MHARQIKTVFHWAGITLAALIIIALQWVATAAVVYGIMSGIGWLIARLAGDREQASN